MEFLINYLSAKVRTSVRHFPGLSSPVKGIGFTKGFEPTTFGVDHQRSNRLSHEVNRELEVGIKVFNRGNGEIQPPQTV